MTPSRRGVLFCCFIGVFYFWISPPLFNYDGYTYRLQGLAPLQNMNQTHLIWVPFQWVLWQLSYLFHTASPRFFQMISMLILTVVYLRAFRLWTRLSDSAATAAVLTLFVACAPPVWYLGSQNEPYPLLFLCVVMVLSQTLKTPSPSMGEGRDGGKSRCCNPPTLALLHKEGGNVCKTIFWFTLAALLHQAAVLLCIGFAITQILLGKGSLRARCQKAFLWLSAVGFFVGGSYFLVAWLKGVQTLPEFWNWLLGYIHTQHHLQGHWYEDLAKSIAGIVYTILPLQAQEDRLYAHFNDAQIRAGLLTLCGILALAAIACVARFWRKIRSLPWRKEPVLGLSIALIVSWAFFAIFWEPTNYYWAVALFPALTLAARALRSPSRWRMPVLAGLVLISGWNLHGDLGQDAFNARRFPDPQLQLLRAHVAKNDLLLFLKHSWYDGVDYDLLGRCLTLEGYHVDYLLDHYVIRHPAACGKPRLRRATWQSRLDGRFARVFAARQNVFVSQWILRPDVYGDLANSYFLSSYVMEKYQPVAGPALFAEVAAFFKAHNLRPANVRLQNDALLNVSSGSGR